MKNLVDALVHVNLNLKLSLRPYMRGFQHGSLIFHLLGQLLLSFALPGCCCSTSHFRASQVAVSVVITCQYVCNSPVCEGYVVIKEQVLKWHFIRGIIGTNNESVEKCMKRKLWLSCGDS